MCFDVVNEAADIWLIPILWTYAKDGAAADAFLGMEMYQDSDGILDSGLVLYLHPNADMIFHLRIKLIPQPVA